MSSSVKANFVRNVEYQQTGLDQAAAHQLAAAVRPPLPAQGSLGRWLLQRLPWVDAYKSAAGEYELSVAQTVLQVHTRVADLFNQPMNQTEQQLRRTIEALKERQEHELVNSPALGLLHRVADSQRIHAGSGGPTPENLDALLAKVQREPAFFLAHPHAIAAFAQECSRRDIAPAGVMVEGSRMSAWRGIPILPCDKIPISQERTTSILLLRTGEENQGVIGLHHAELHDEHEPSLSVRFLSISERAIISYLVSLYYSVSVQAPDALGVLEHVEIGCAHD